MPDLSTLLGEAARAAQPPDAPPYDALVRRRRARDVRARAVVGGLVLAAALGAASLLSGLPASDRALPPAEGTGDDWRDRLLSDVQLGLQLQYAPAGPSSFGFLLDEGFAADDRLDYRTQVAPDALLDGTVTVSARYRGEDACLRATAEQGVLAWQEPAAEPCTAVERSVLHVGLELAPPEERFAGNPLVRDGELVPPG